MSPGIDKNLSLKLKFKKKRNLENLSLKRNLRKVKFKEKRVVSRIYIFRFGL